MTSLVDAVTGLRYGNGLSFEPGIGSAGLTNGDSQTVVFAGAGLLSALVNQRLAASARFAGAGSFSASASISSGTPVWVPTGDGTAATLFADFTTEGATNHYWYNSTQYAGYAAWLAALGGAYSRAATTNGAWYTNSSGLLASAGTNVLRFNYNPTGPVDIGILLEPAATNLALWSRDLTQSGTWVALNMTTALTSVGADGTSNSATRLTATAPSATILQTPGAASSSYVYSVYLRRVTGTGTIKITADGSTYSTDLSSSLNGTTYTRIPIALTSAVPVVGIQIGTSGDAIDADFNQLEAGGATNVPTSPILTTSASVTRAIDSLTWPVPFTGWSTSVGSTVTIANTGTLQPNIRGYAFSDGTTANRIAMNLVTSTGNVALIVFASSVSQASITAAGSNTSSLATNKIGHAWAVNDFVAIVNASTPGTDISGSVPSGINIITLGSAGVASSAISINLASFAYWGSRISNAGLQTLTT